MDFNLQKSHYHLPDGNELHVRLEEVKAELGSPAEGPPGARDVFDLQEYVQNNFERNYADFAAQKFWEDAAEIANCLSVDERAKLFSTLWGDLEGFTDMYLRLVLALDKLGYAEEAYCGIDALMQPGDGEGVRHQNSIVNVNILNNLGKDDKDELSVFIKKNDGPLSEVSLPRSNVAALIAEMQLDLGDYAFPFFDHADLLDFPGARSRINAEQFEDAVKGASDGEGAAETGSAGAQYLLRGKVAYLFQRYVNERELTGMLLCVAESNQEVNSLGGYVNDWVHKTLGNSSEIRAKNINTLFLVLTKMDREFERAQGQDESSMRGRWDGRLSEGLIKFFDRYGWPTDWDGTPFKNSFWLRNPAFANPNVMRYENEIEVELNPDNIKYINTMRQYCLDGQLVQTHFSDPVAAYDAALKIGDGGVGYLVEALAKVCTPDLKIQQIENMIDDQAGQIISALKDSFDGDGDEKRAERLTEATQTVVGLGACMGKKRFGELLRHMQLDMDEIVPIYSGVGIRLTEEENEPVQNIAVGASVNIDNIFAGIDTAASPSPKTEDEGVGLAKDRCDVYADEVIKYWTNKIFRMPGDEMVHTFFLIPEEIMHGFVRELQKGAERIGLRVEIAKRVRAESRHANAQWDQILMRNALITGSIINRYIDWLNVDQMSAEERPGIPAKNPTHRAFEDMPEFDGLPQLPDDPSSKSVEDFCKDWIVSFIRLAEDNAGFSGGGELTKEQNAKLGEILATVRSGDS
jgi:hypothetical protein